MQNEEQGGGSGKESDQPDEQSEGTHQKDESGGQIAGGVGGLGGAQPGGSESDQGRGTGAESGKIGRSQDGPGGGSESGGYGGQGGGSQGQGQGGGDESEEADSSAGD
jgi:hypothetical protein